MNESDIQHFIENNLSSFDESTDSKTTKSAFNFYDIEFDDDFTQTNDDKKHGEIKDTIDDENDDENDDEIDDENDDENDDETFDNFKFHSTTEKSNFDDLIVNMECYPYNRRPNWDTHFILMAKLVSIRSTCAKLRVGCVITKRNVVLSMGYNGFPAGAPHEGIERDGHEILTVHAEMNAIANACKNRQNLYDATAYVTHCPCFNCLKLLTSAGIKRILYLNDYHNDKYLFKYCALIGVSLYKFAYETMG